MNFFLIIFLTCRLAAAAVAPLMGDEIISGHKLSWSWNHAQLATVVVFLSADCPCSHAHIDYLKKIKNDFPEYHFIAIHSNTDEDEKMTLEYFQKINLNFEVIQDQKAHMANDFGASRTPHAYLVSKTGEILYQGGVTNSSNAQKANEFHLAKALNDFKNGNKIKQSRTRVLGCEITRN